MADTIPEDWVLLEAAKRCEWPFDATAQDHGIEELQIDYRRGGISAGRAFRALCDMIAKHEQPPVDPDEKAVKRIINAWHGHEYINWPHHANADALARAVSQYKQEKANG